MTPKHRVVVTGVGLVSPLGIGTEETWAGSRRRPLRCGADHALRRLAPLDPLRLRGEGVRPAALPREEGSEEGRPLHPVRGRGRRVRARGQRARDHGRSSRRGSGVYIGSGIGGFATIEREHSELLKGGPRRISPFFIPAVIVNLASGWVSIRSGAKGPELGHGHRLHQRRPRRGRLVPADPARRRGGDDRRRLGGGDHTARRRRLLRDARALHAQRRAGEGLAALRQGPRRLRDRRGLRHPGARGARARPGARGEHLRRDRGLRHVGRRLPHLGPERGRRRRRARDAGDARGRGRAAGSGRLHQRARHLDAARRRGRDDRHQDGLRRARAHARAQLDEVDDGTPAGRRRRARGGDRGARAARTS